MKKILFICTLSLMLLCSCVPVFAVESETPVDGSAVVETTDNPSVVIVQPQTPAETPDNVTVSQNIYSVAEEEGTLPALVRSIFGEYRGKEYSVTEYDSEGNEIGVSTAYVPGLAGLDWYWLCGVFLFTVVLYSFFRMVGLAFKR